MWGLGLDEASLERIGLTLGADVPFCLHGGLAHVTGVGEKMADLPAAPEWPLVIVQPCEGLNTGAVFRAFHAGDTQEHPDTPAAMDALLTGSMSALVHALGNSLEPVSLAMAPAIGEAIARLMEEGAILAKMSGSGSAVFGVFATPDAAAAASVRIQKTYERTFVCTTCTPSIVL